MSAATITSGVASGVNSVVNNAFGQIEAAVGAASHSLTPAAKQLFVIYTRQAELVGHIEVWIPICMAIACLVPIALGFVVSFGTSAGNNVASDAPGVGFFLTGLAMFLLAVVLGAVLIPLGVLHIANPEYYALQNLGYQLSNIAHGGGS